MRNKIGQILFLLSVIVGFVCTTISLYQLLVLKHAHFYTLFSIGMSLLLSIAYNRISRRRLFSHWGLYYIFLFCAVMFLVSIFIDKLGLRAGYWEYPHYDRLDEFRKYLFEWVVALFYHLVTLLLGFELLLKRRVDSKWAFALSLLLFVTVIGLITESLNIQVYSWRVRRMPISNFQIGNYFIVFQTLGYWLMALIPFAIYIAIERITVLRNGRKAV